MAEADFAYLTGSKSYNALVSELYYTLLDKGSKITNMNIGGVARTLMLELPAQGFADLHELLTQVAKQGFVQYATGGWLDLCAGDLMVTRRSEQFAYGVVQFTRNENVKGNIRIPKNTIVKTPTGPDGHELRFFVTTDTILLAEQDTVDVPVRAELAGSAYSVGAGYITELVTHVNGISSVNNTESWLTQEGADIESDDDLRSRCILRWHELSQGSTKYAYQSWALSVDGVREAYILDQHPRGQGTVDVVIVGTGGTPSQALIDEVQALIETKRPICSDVLVRAPGTRRVDIDVEVYIHPVEGREEDINAEVAKAIDALFVANASYPNIKPLSIGEDVTIARIIHAIMEVEGVFNVTVYAPNEDIEVDADELAVKTGVKILVKRLNET